MHILFVQRKSQKDEGLVTIYCRVTAERQRTQFSTNITVPSKQWDAARQRIRGKLYEAQNEQLRYIEQALRDIAVQLAREGKSGSSRNIVEAYSREEASTMTFMQAYHKFIAQTSVMKSLSPTTVRNWNVRAGKVEAFLKKEKRLSMGLEDVNMPLLRRFYASILEEGLTNNFAKRCTDVIRSVMKWATEMEIIKTNPVQYFSTTHQSKKQLVSLTDEELASIVKKRFKDPRMQEVADAFVFQCFTGLAFQELKNFRRSEHLEKDSEGHYWIHMQRQKTLKTNSSGSFTVPLLEEAANRLNKYGESFPVTSTQIYNKYLKAVVAACGIEKKITSHIGRKTFAMQMLNRYGISIETVSSMLGHQNTRVTQRHYAEVTKQRISQEMKMKKLIS